VSVHSVRAATDVLKSGMRGTLYANAQRALAEPVSEEVVTLIVVAMLASITIVLSGAADLVTFALSALV
jgi:hypothetical protein